MKIDQLTYFLETARHEHVGKAAKVLNISPSAISHSITNLEHEFGRKLFSKQGKRIFLTNHGKLLAERAELLLQEIARIKDEISDDHIELQGHYKIAGTHVFSSIYLAPAWARVTQKHPKLTCELYSLRSAEVLQRVTNGELDLGICLSPQSGPGYEAEVLREEPMVIVVRRRHPVLHENYGKDLTVINRYPAALPKAFQGIENCETHPDFKKVGVVPRPHLMYDSYSVAVQAMLYSDMWGLVPESIYRHYEKSLEVVSPKSFAPKVNVSAVWPRNRLVTSTLRLLIDEIKRQISQVG